MWQKFFNKFFYLAAFFIFIGILFLCLKAQTVMLFSYRLVCIIIIIIGIFKLVFSDKRALGKREYVFDIIEGFVNIVVGVVCYNFYHIYIVSLIFGAMYLVVPILRIAFSANKLNQFLLDIFKFIFASMLIISSYKSPELTKIYSSVIFLLIGVLIIVIKVYLSVKNIDINGRDLK